MSLVPPRGLGEMVELGKILLRLVFAEDVLEGHQILLTAYSMGPKMVDYLERVAWLRFYRNHPS